MIWITDSIENRRMKLKNKSSDYKKKKKSLVSLPFPFNLVLDV